MKESCSSHFMPLVVAVLVPILYTKIFYLLNTIKMQCTLRLLRYSKNRLAVSRYNYLAGILRSTTLIQSMMEC